MDTTKMSYAEIRTAAGKAGMKNLSHAKLADMKAFLNSLPKDGISRTEKVKKMVTEKPVKPDLSFKVDGQTIDRKKVIKSDLSLTVKICILNASGMSNEEINEALNTTHAKGLLYNYTKRSTGNSRYLKAVLKYKTI